MAAAPKTKAGKAPPKPSKPSPKSPEKAARPAKAEAAAEAGARGAKPGRSRVPFPKKNQPPSEPEFLARLPLAVGKKFDGVRTFLRKQRGVSEDLYFYGPKTGWAYRYLYGTHSLATIMIHGDHLMGIVALDAAALGEVDFTALSDVGERARRLAHGSPSLSWLDLPLDGPGASDFKVLLKAKLRTLPENEPASATGAPTPATNVAPRGPSAQVLPPPPPPPPRGRKSRPA